MKYGEKLTIDLKHNKLNETSFSLNSLSNFKRRILLDVRENQIKYLEKQIFHPFFVANQKNRLYFSGLHLDINDEKNSWIDNEVCNGIYSITENKSTRN